MAGRSGRRKRSSGEPPFSGARDVLDVTIVLLDAGYVSTAIVPIEVFHSAGVLWNWLRGEAVEPRFRVRIASLDGKSISSLCGIGVTPSCSIHEIEKTDIIILPASGLDVIERIARSTVLLPWLRKWHDRGTYIAGICSGVALLAQCGLLDGRQATTHWAVADILRQQFPKVRWQPEQFVTEDGQLFCSGGVYASIDLSLYLVEKFCGHEVALKCAKSLLLSMPRGRQAGYAVLPLSPPHTDAKIKQAEDHLREHFAGDASIDSLAARAGMSTRTFIRRFKAATGRLPGAYVQMLRVSIAKERLEHGATSVQSVASAIGYNDVAFFRSLFKRHTGMTPAEYRARFAHMNFDRGELPDGNERLNNRQ